MWGYLFLTLVGALSVAYAFAAMSVDHSGMRGFFAACASATGSALSTVSFIKMIGL